MTTSAALPSGTVTFLFTDIEGSTRLWDKRPQAMRIALARHDELMRAAIEGNHGHVFKTIGDAFCAVFHTPRDAMAAAITAQEGLGAENWGEVGAVRVRMALHTGTAEERDNDYFGPTLNRVARLLAVGHGGQILLSNVSQALVVSDLAPPVSLRDMGSHQLKDLNTPEQIFQLCAPSLSDNFPPLRSLSRTLTNLPIQASSFIGREQEIAEVKRLLEETRLLTLTGSGGCGKTRLALQIGAEVMDQFADGVWLVELAPLSDQEQVPRAVASVLGVREASERDWKSALIDDLRSRQLLLVLDNCEHVLAAVPSLANDILRNCPRVVILTTSREGLGIPGEMTHRVPSLPLPEPGGPPPGPDEVIRYAAVQLFVERARFVRNDFAVTEANAPILTRICRQLDGMPLTLELAAARVRAMTVEQIEVRLNDRFRLLTGGSRVAEPRQQTLRGLIDWSYELLTSTERTLFHRLAAFTGGCTLESCEAVGVGGEIESWEVLDLLTALVDKSLVVYQEGTVSRYRLLESIREYAQERLLGSGEDAACRLRHREFFRGWTRTQSERITTEEQAAAYHDIDADYENIRRAMEWSEARGDIAAALELAKSLARYWYDRGLLSEARRWLRNAMTHPEIEPNLRARTLNNAAIFAMTQGDLTEAQNIYEEALCLYEDLNDKERIAASYNNLGLLAHARQDYAGMEDYHQRSLEIYRDLDDTQGIIATLSNLGLLSLETGAYGQARERFEEALERIRPTGDQIQMATVLQNLGTAALRLKDYSFARSRLSECIALQCAAGAQNTISAANALIELARLTLHEGDDTGAIRRAGAAQAILDRLGVQSPESHQSEFEDLLGELKGRQGQSAYETLWSQGLTLTLDDFTTLEQ